MTSLGPAVSVRVPPVGEWLSLVEHLVRDQGVGGSNPLSPTNLFPIASLSWRASYFRDFHNLGPFGSDKQIFDLLHRRPSVGRERSRRLQRQFVHAGA